MTTGSKAVSDGITSLNTSINDILKEMKESGGELPSSTEIALLQTLISSTGTMLETSITTESILVTDLQNALFAAAAYEASANGVAGKAVDTVSQAEH
ncbi:MAG: hypothetical protein V8S22_06925 [Lachnospiraceae bacterium]